MVRKLVAASAAALALFHIWLFAGQLWNGAIVAEPDLLARWAVAGVLVAALEGLRRRGASLIRGRKAVAIWLVALLLHGPAIADRGAALDPQALPEVIVTLVTASLALACLGAARGWRRPVVVLRRLALVARIPGVVPRLTHGAFVRFAARPPPIA